MNLIKLLLIAAAMSWRSNRRNNGGTPPRPTIRPELELLPDRTLPALFTLGGLQTVTAFTVSDTGALSGVGTSHVGSLVAGQHWNVSTSGAYSQNQIGTTGLTSNTSIVPLDFNGNVAVGYESGVSLTTGQPIEKAFSVDFATNVVTNLGSMQINGANDLTRAFTVNASNQWGGHSSAGALAVYGQSGNANSFTIVPTPSGSLATVVDNSANGTMLLLVTPFASNTIEASVRTPDGTLNKLVNPYAVEGSTMMLDGAISPNGTKVVETIQRYNPVLETWSYTVGVFSGPAYSTFTPIPTLTGESYWGKAVAILDSGMVALQGDNGVALWQPGWAAPKTLDELKGANDTIPAGTTTFADHAGAPLVQKGGATFVGFSVGGQAHVLQIGTFTPVVPPPSDPPTTIYATANGVTSVDVSQFHTATTITVYATVGAGQRSVVNFVGTADHPMNVVYVGGAGVNIVNFGANGALRVTADLGAGNDFWNGGSSNAKFSVHGGAGSDVLIGGSNADALFGDGGGDLLFGNAGDDELWTGSGVNFVDGGTGADKIHSGSRFDFVVALDPNDELWGDPLFLVGRPKRRR